MPTTPSALIAASAANALGLGAMRLRLTCRDTHIHPREAALDAAAHAVAWS